MNTNFPNPGIEKDNCPETGSHDLAVKFEAQIKDAIVKKPNSNVSADELSLFLKDKAGVYLSKEDPDTLCCLVCGNKNGLIYLVTAKITENGQELADFKSDAIG